MKWASSNMIPAQPIARSCEQIVVHDDPMGVLDRLTIEPHDLNQSLREDHPDFTAPIELEGRRAHYEDWPRRSSDLHGGDGLPGFPQAHIIPEDGSFLGQEKRDTVRLMRG